jgi:hypothetical protein
MNMRRLLPAVAVALALLPLARLGKAQQPEVPMLQPNPQGVAPQAAPAGSCPVCDDNCACAPQWQIFAEALYLQPRNAGVEYAVPIYGPVVLAQAPLQMGRTALVDPGRSLGFSIGAARDLDECSGISVAYSYYGNIATDSIKTNAPLFLQSMVMNPSSFDAANYWNSASAREFIGFQLADADYRYTICCSPCSSVNCLLGFRYAHLGQQFDSNFESNYSAAVSSGVNFDGVGLRAGLEAERHNCAGLFVYGKTSASFLGGNVQANYLQTSSLVSGPVATTTWDETRLVPILDGELGVGWAPHGGHLRASIGYVMAGWLNVVKPSDFIASVQANSYHEAHALGQSDMVFDGFVGHLELNW